MALHSYSVFDQELENLRAQVMEMGGIVEEQIKDAVSTPKPGMYIFIILSLFLIKLKLL